MGSTENLAADGDGSRTIDEGDFDVWKSHFGNTLGSGSGADPANHSVPEPATMALLVICILALGVPRYRRG